MLVVKELEVFYKDIQALWGISLEVREGEIVTLLGGNGAGKSTTLKTISGLLRPSSGEIWIGETRIDKVRPSRRIEYGISHVPEAGGLFPNMTVCENLVLGAYPKKAWKKRNENLESIYEFFPRLKNRKDQLAGTLSGGERQMLAIGRGLMSNPSILMLDEPSIGLAPNLVEEIFIKLVEINKEGMSILLLEQHVQHALQIANKGYVLETGMISLEGKASDLLENSEIKRSYLGM